MRISVTQGRTALVNAALLMMTSTLMAGADVAPAAPAPGPVVVSAGPGCSGPGCGSGCGAADSCDAGGKVGLFGKMKARMGCHHCAPAPAPVACDTCGTATASRPNLFDKLKGKFGKHHKSADCGCAAPACDGCATGVGPVVAPTTITPVDPPKDMPKVKEPVKEPVKPAPKTEIPTKPVPSPGTGLPTIPTPGAVVIPSSPVTPVSGPKLTGTSSPY